MRLNRRNLAVHFLAISLAGLSTAASCHRPAHPPSSSSAPSPSATDREDPAHEEKGVLPLYDDHPDHPFNRVHRALFRNPREVSRTPCLLKSPRDCDKRDTPYDVMLNLRTGPSDYEETSPLFAFTDVRALGEGQRFVEAMSALRDALHIGPLDNPLAASLLQHDLWERFDTLDAALRTPALEGELLPSSPTTTDPLRMLRDQIGMLMRRLALPVAAIEKIPSNLEALARAYPDLLAGIAKGEAAGQWLEVATRSRSLPDSFDSPFREGTRHAMMAGYRAAFRRFVHIPDDGGQAVSGADWLQRSLAEQPATLTLPPGARVVIMEIPLVISAESEIVPLPIISLIESRHISAAPQQGHTNPFQLSSLGFDVLDARRALLRQPSYPFGGLHRLAFDDPFPLGGTCGPNPLTLLPMRATCVMCHGQAGDQLTGTLSHGSQKLRISREGDLQVRVTIDAKKARPDFAALRALFRAADVSLKYEQTPDR